MSLFKKYAPYTLVIIALFGSRTTLVLFDDPEGPNLLVVFVVAAVVYLPSLLVYTYYALSDHTKGLGLAVLTQVVLLGSLYLLGS